MASWPNGWHAATLTASGIPVTEFAVKVLQAWADSTPTEPWTNNPIGIPSHGYGAPRALNTEYAAFPTMQAFRTAFTRALSSGRGVNIHHALTMCERYSDAWREIHALKWPSNGTESEYPIKLMDMVSGAYGDRITYREGERAKTTGATHAPPEVHSVMRMQAHRLRHASTHFKETSDAIAFLLRG